ncbi:COMM domain-containing protein 4-like isoform X1 [Epargyreus clarus]|uniref:COMM domain-containing protein 4-like isoform X1 n=1 Tax=Epargyreus clarus TaxID=520877 RepID=UPI003C2D2AF4
MKFKFCSDVDCPLWALAALHALGSLPAPLFRGLLQHIVEEQPDDGIMEILKDTSLSSREECARAAAVLRWTLRQAHRCSCTGAQLTKDLLVLGVPRAHAAALGEAADETREAYETLIKSNGFMINKLTDVSASSGPEGTVDTIKLTLHSDEVFTGEQKMAELLIDKAQAKTLLEELKKAHKKMEEIDME